MTALVRKNARGEREHVTHDGWIRVGHDPSLPVSSGSGRALEELSKLALNVRPDFSLRDIMAPIACNLALLPIVPAHDAPPSAPETATLDFSRVENV